jgi:hypothetical protein
MSDDAGLFGPCETLSEIIVCVNHILGLDAVEQLLVQGKADLTKESLRKASREIEIVGLTELAKVVRGHIKKVRRGPPTFASRWSGR